MNISKTAVTLFAGAFFLVIVLLSNNNSSKTFIITANFPRFKFAYTGIDGIVWNTN